MEQAQVELTQEQIDDLTYEKRQEEAEQADRSELEEAYENEYGSFE